MNRFSHMDLIVCKVLHGEISAFRLHGGNNLLRNLTLVENFFSLLRDQTQRIRQVGVFDDAPHVPGHLIRIQIDLCRSLEFRDLPVGIFDVPACNLGHFKTVFRHIDRRLHDGLPVHSAVGVQRIEHALHLAGNRDRQRADFIRLVLYLTVFQHFIHIQAGRCAGNIPEINKDDLPGFRKADRHKPAAADPGGLLLGDAQGKTDGDRRIDRVAAGF